MKPILPLAFIILQLIISAGAFAQNNQQIKKDMSPYSSLESLHDSTKSLSAQLLFKGTEGSVRSLQIKKNGMLPEHITEVPAILICVKGQVLFEDEKGAKQLLVPGGFYRIEPKLKHWVKGMEDSQLLLVK
jgi:quercetin dioxygenase-like cupin family protein